MRDFKQTRTPDPKGRWLRFRVQGIALFFFALLAVCFGRAFWLQVFQRQKLRVMAEEQYVRDIEIPARRGDIVDRRGVPLAQSTLVDSIWIDPSMSPDIPGTARLLAKKLKLPTEEIVLRMQKGKRFAWVKRQARPDEVTLVSSLNIPGIGITKEPRRFYPQRELAAQLIGWVGNDGHGLEGLELAFEDELSGEKGKVSGLRDAKGRKLLPGGALDSTERQGAQLTLTLEGQIQHVTERALARAVEDSKATSGMAVVLNPKTGEVLAMANHPRFNPNTPGDARPEALKNRVVLDTFEPGSTLKAFIIAAALEQGAVKPDDTIFCENGRMSIGRHVIHDTHPHGALTPGRILQVSSNIGMAKIAQMLGRDGLVDAYTRFGFAQKSGLSLPGEGRGSLPFPKADITLATQSFGQGMTATALQIAAAYGVIANGGVLMRPYVVSQVTDSDGLVLLRNKPTEVRRVLSQPVAERVLSMLEGVTDREGTAPRARMEGYRVAGKTGTAQKVDPVAKGYSEKRIASFVGMVPAPEPKAVILVVIDEPRTDVYGGLVAAPAFKEIAETVMPYMGVAPQGGTRVASPSPPASRPKSKPLPARPTPAEAREETAQEAITEEHAEGWVEVPNLKGKVGREAVVNLLGAALEPHISGTGRVISQSPAPGIRVEKGTRVTLKLASRP